MGEGALLTGRLRRWRWPDARCEMQDLRGRVVRVHGAVCGLRVGAGGAVEGVHVLEISPLSLFELVDALVEDDVGAAGSRAGLGRLRGGLLGLRRARRCQGKVQKDVTQKDDPPHDGAHQEAKLRVDGLVEQERLHAAAGPSGGLVRHTAARAEDQGVDLVRTPPPTGSCESDKLSARREIRTSACE